MNRRVLSLASSIGILALSVACSSGPAAPTAPTVIESPTSPPPLSVGVIIEGTVGLGNGTLAQADGVRALASTGGARVSVVGQNASTVTDSGGRFSLKGVAPGRTELRFEASGVDARLVVGNLAQGQTVSVDVQVSGQTATPRSEDRGAAEVALRGRIESIGGSQVQVGGRKVSVDGATRILDRQNAPIAFGALKSGDTVQVEGVARPDGSVLASKIKLEDDDAAPGGVEVNFRGSITSTSPLTVAGRTVVSDGATRVLDRLNNPIALSALALGGFVEVEGVSRPDGSVLAKKIKQEDGPDAPDAFEVKLTGTISGLNPLVVAGRNVAIDGATRLLDKRNNPVAMSFFKAGDLVELEGTTRADGVILAKKIKQQD